MRGVAVLTITGVLSQLVGFVYRIGLTRLAGAEILGLYQLILPVYSVLLSLTSVGLTTAVSNLSAWYQALGNQRAIYQVRGQAVKLFFLLALMPCSLLLLFSDGASVYLLGDARTQLGLILLVPCLLLTGTENLQKHYFYGTGRVYPAAITELAEQVLRSLLVLALLWRLAPDTAEKAVGTIELGMALCEALIPRLLVQGGMDQGEAVSAYGVTFGMTLPMLLLPTAFLSALGLVLTPKLSQYSALGQKEAIRRQVKRSVGAANLILIPALALLAVLGSAIGQSLYRDDRVGEHLPLLALGVLFSCWQPLSACVLSGVNRQGASAGIALAADSVQLVLTCLTVGRWGMGGYAFSFALSALLGAVLSWRVVSREIGLSLPVFSWFTAPTLAACLAASCGDLMETVLLRAGLVSFPAAVGGLCFGLLLYLAALQAMGAGSKGGGLPP